MNERTLSPQLLKLVQAAGPGYSLANPEWIKKFAELIIRECMEQCAYIPDSSEDWDKGVKWAYNQIKQHFGVEE